MKRKWIIALSVFFLVLGFFTGSVFHAMRGILAPSQPRKLEGVYICKVIYDPLGSEPDNEMIKICNLFETPIDISGWVLTDGEGSYTIPQDTIIPAEDSWSIIGSTYNPSGDINGLSLDNDGDTVNLYDPKGVGVDIYSYKES